ncbi:MAG TPA: hypothetical protein IAA15_07600 [Candidatus Olsenella pullicola]|nr:hypothetical protein [Candidatus Olsenella pullicola]
MRNDEALARHAPLGEKPQQAGDVVPAVGGRALEQVRRQTVTAPQVGGKDVRLGRVVGKVHVRAELAHAGAQGLGGVAGAAHDHVRARRARAHGVGKHVATGEDASAKEGHHVRPPRTDRALERVGRQCGHVARPEKLGELVDVGGQLLCGHGRSLVDDTLSRPLSRDKVTEGVTEGTGESVNPLSPWGIASLN